MASLSLSLNKNPNPPVTGLFPKQDNLNRLATKTSAISLNKPFSSKKLENEKTTIMFTRSSVSSTTSTHDYRKSDAVLSHDHPHPHHHNHHHVDEATLLLQNEEDERPLREIWREIQGSNDWEGLVDPLNSCLRREIIRYGEFAQACYDSFDFDPNSKYCGTCKYPGAHFFEKLEMADRGYKISRYLYATSNINLPNFFQRSKMSSVWSQHANWMGYVAVSTDEDEIRRLGRRDIVIAWRGTVTYLEWICDLKDILRSADFGPDPTVKIESGFYDLYTKKERGCKYCSFSAREQVLAEIKRLLDYYEGEEISITVTGHSLGSALAILSAYDMAEVGLNVVASGKKVPITVYSFAGPRVGNLKFKGRCDELGIKVLRVVNVHDVVPTVPGIIANEKRQFQKYIEETMSFPWSYAHVGVELRLDQSHSPFLKPTKDPGCAHNLEVHLHLVDGYHGKGKRFCLETKRDIALVNKNCDLLRSEYGVPSQWRQDENKGMVRNTDGRWVLPERPRLEGHPPDMAEHLEKVLMIKRNSNSNGGVHGTSSPGLEAS
ncbi:Phospholipase A1-Igamma3 [Morus notabilis]|uniref:Phospholipase A1-Igamma3 n=1 Tax=Morus notabilis TaxID=981085 RepID=W9S735_9ROSA|nr:phospholipase A1-Igamma3, chloroplastic [Morus notabilis]EXB93327.1 Phospholipase A1-Igamma3 [Morus notabilis]